MDYQLLHIALIAGNVERKCFRQNLAIDLTVDELAVAGQEEMIFEILESEGTQIVKENLHIYVGELK